jgi:hypothetical protein
MGATTSGGKTMHATPAAAALLTLVVVFLALIWRMIRSF